jgi:predicted nucleic acid-binding protein
VSLVLDSSITLAWVYADERTAVVEQVFDQILVGGAWVPTIWRLEVANGLQQGIRRGRIDTEYRNGAIADLIDLNVAIDPDTNLYAWERTLALAEQFRLTTYDASYLELARRRGLPLASLDHDLRWAAERSHVSVLGL